MKKITTILLVALILASCTKIKKCECIDLELDCIEGALVNLEETYKLKNCSNEEITIYAHFIPDNDSNMIFEIKHKLPTKYQRKSSSHVCVQYQPLVIFHPICKNGYELCCIEDIE